jgi:hypothetical protein
MLATLCAEVGADCPPGFTLQLRLYRAPDSLLSLYSPFRLSTVYLDGQQTTLLSLPAPTLVGLPVDEAGYQVLYRGYAAQMALALLNMFAADSPVFDFRGTLAIPDFATKLADLGLFMPWSPEFNPLRAVTPPPIPFPEEGILLMCQSSRAPSLFRYDLEQEVWQDVLLHAEGLVNNALVHRLDGQGVLLTVGPSVRDNMTRLVWLHDGREQLLLEIDDRFWMYEVTELPNGRFLVHYAILEPKDVVSHHGTVLDTLCRDDFCEPQPFESESWLSPDGRHTLVVRVDEEEGLVYALGDADGRVLQEIGALINPFWLDGQTLAFMRLDWQRNPIRSELVTAVFPQNEAGEIDIQVQLIGKDVGAANPGMSLPRVPVIVWAGGYSPERPDDPPPTGNDDSFVAHYNWRRKELSFLELPNEGEVTFVGASPNGRYLIFSDANGDTPALHLYDPTIQAWQHYEKSSTLYPQKSQQIWSNDGNWLALMEGDTVRLIAPAYNYEKLIYHGLDFCETVTWMN